MNFDTDSQPTGGPILGPAPSRFRDSRLALILFFGILDMALILVVVLVQSQSTQNYDRQIPGELVVGTDVDTASAFALPVVDGAEPWTPGPRDVVVNLSADGRVFMNGRFLSLEALKERLQKLGQEDPLTAILLRADGNAALRHAVTVFSAVREAGISRIGILTEAEPTNEDLR